MFSFVRGNSPQKTLEVTFIMFSFTTQGWTSTYFETCRVGQLRVIFTCSEMKIHFPTFFVWYTLTGFSVPTTAQMLQIQHTHDTGSLYFKTTHGTKTMWSYICILQVVLT